METPALKAIYVDMDALLDTRLGLLRQHLGMSTFPDAYWKRDTDDWPRFTEDRLDRQAFYQLWLKRDTETLKHSFITNIIFHIQRCMQAQVTDGMLFEDNRLPCLVVNLWPYVLSDDEQQEFCLMLSQYFKVLKAQVKCMFKDPKLLTPDYVHAHFAMMTSYNGIEWLGVQHQDLTRKSATLGGPLHGFPLTVPRLYQRDAQSLTAQEKQQMHTEMRLLMLEFIQLDYIDVYWFSEFGHKLDDRSSDDQDDLIKPRGTNKSFKL